MKAGERFSFHGRQPAFFLFRPDGPQKESHVSAQVPHGLQSFPILFHVRGGKAVHLEIVKYLFSASKDAVFPPRRQLTTAAPAFMCLEKGVE